MDLGLVSDCNCLWASQKALVVQNLPADAGDPRYMSSTPGWGRSPGVGYDTTLQYSCPENSMGREAWRAADHGAAESDMTDHMHTHTHTHTHRVASIVTISDRACQTSFQRTLIYPPSICFANNL